MEKIWNLALVTASESYRRKVFWLILLFLVAEVVLLGLVGVNLEATKVLFKLEQGAPFTVRGAVAQALRQIEVVGMFFGLTLFVGLIPSDRKGGLLEYYLTQPVSSDEYVLGKFLGGVLVVSFFLMTALGILFTFQYRFQGAIGGDLVQGTCLLVCRICLCCGLGFLLSARWKALPAWLGGFFLFHGPMWFWGQALRPDAPDWLRVVGWPLPAFDWFRAGKNFGERLVLVPQQAYWLYAYAAVSVALILFLAGRLFARQEVLPQNAE